MEENKTNADKFFNVLASIVTLAIVAVVVQEGTNTAKVVKAFGDAFGGSIKAAKN